MTATTSESLDGPAAAVSEAETLFRSSEYAAAFDLLNRLDFALLPASVLDRVLPLMLMAAEATAGEEFALRWLDTVERVTGGASIDASSIVKVYRAEATADPHHRAELTSSALGRLSVSTAPVTRHRALAVLLGAKVDLGQGLDHDLLAHMEKLEQQIELIAPVDSALAQRGLLAYQVGLLDESRNALKQLRCQTQSDDEVFMEQIFATHMATVDAYAGRSGDARRLLSSIKEVGPQSPAAARAAGLVAVKGADEQALQSVLLQPTVQGSEAHGALTRHGLIGLAAARREDWREAYCQLSQALTLADSLGVKEPGRRMWIDFDFARAAIGIGRPTEAGRIADRLEELSSTSRPLIDGVVSRIRALLTRDLPQSIEMLQESVAVLAGAGFPEQLILSLLELGRRLLTARRVDDARDALDRAQIIAEQTGDIAVGLLVDRAQRLTSSEKLFAALTTREREVAQAAAGGASSRQIAEESFTSVRTVQTQLSSIYRKLGITSRLQLTILFADHVRATRHNS